MKVTLILLNEITCKILRVLERNKKFHETRSDCIFSHGPFLNPDSVNVYRNIEDNQFSGSIPVKILNIPKFP